jgi:uncharacterized protein (DUF952 family)
MLIYHIVLPEVWEKFRDKDEYEAESLKTEGFIHCSYKNQIDEVLQRYYKEAEKVIILHINPHFLKSELAAEPSTNCEIFPHIYGKINKSAIIETEEKFLAWEA